MKDIRKYLIIGLIGAMITVLAEFLIGYSASIDNSTYMNLIITAYGQLETYRIGLGSSIGTIGILMQYYGFLAIYYIFDNQTCLSSRIFKFAIIVFFVVGAIIHVVLCSSIFVYHINVGSKLAIEYWLRYIKYFVLPIMPIFIVSYLLSSIILFIKIVKAKTLLPKIFCILNPVLFKMFIDNLVANYGGSAIINAIGFANMGLSSLTIFATILIYIIKTYDNYGTLTAQIDEEKNFD